MNELIYRFLIRVFSFLFPLKKNKIIFISYYGSQYGCNPKYLSQYIVNHNSSYDVVWVFNDPSKYNIEHIRKVRNYSIRFFYELSTAKIIVTNYRMPLWFSKRRGQCYIQTWHSSLRLKTIEKDAESKLPEGYVEMAKKDSESIDCLISGCKFSTKIFESAFWYNGEILECGTPRNDMFFCENHSLKRILSEKYNFPETNKLVLYAPTFRQNYNFAYYNLDYTALERTLTERFGGSWTILVRLHPHLKPYSQQLLGGKHVIDVTDYDDIQELLCVTDVLISDYSSLIFDFTFTGRPCFLYIPDFVEYVKKDRKLYFDINELPFIKAFSNEGMYKAIINYNESEYHKAMDAFDQKIGSYENGNACKLILDYINNRCKK